MTWIEEYTFLLLFEAHAKFRVSFAEVKRSHHQSVEVKMEASRSCSIADARSCLS